MTMNHKLEEALKAVSSVHECSSLNEAAENLFAGCRKIIGIDGGCLGMISEDEDSINIIYLDSISPPNSAAHTISIPIRSIVKECIEQKKPVSENNSNCSIWEEGLPEGNIETNQQLFAPIMVNKRVIGVIGLFRRNEEFIREDINIINFFANNLAIAYRYINDRQKLEKSENKWKKLFDNLPIGVYVTDSMEQISEMNNKMLELLGIEKKEEFRGNDILQYYVNPQDRIEWQKQLESSGSVNYLETRFKVKNDQIIWISENANIIEEPDGRQYCEGSIEDITTRKRAEEAYLQTYLKLNDAHKDLSDKAEWMQKLNSFLIEMVAISDRTDLNGEFLKKLQQYLEAEFLCVSLFDENIDKLNIRGIRNNKEISSIIDVKTEDFILLSSNSHDFKIIKHSDSKLQKLKTEFASFISDLVSEKADEVVILPMEQNSKKVGNIIISFKTGTLNDNLLYFLKSSAEFFSLININISLLDQVKESYQQLKTAQDTMKKQERIKAMGQIASGITHDINNTLAPITLYTEALVETEAGLSDRAVKYLNTIQNAVADIENVTQRLRTFYKQDDEQNFELIKIDELFDEVIELTRPKWKNIPNKKGIVIILRKDIKDKSASFKGVKSDVREALMNCVFNSVDALPDGGEITLEAELLEEKVLIKISDTGTGMEDEHLNHCLEPFFTTKGASGSGLGLAEVQGMIQRHSGEMKVESSKGNGTSIFLYFDKILVEDKKTACSDMASEGVNAKSLKIMCVDDDIRIIEGLKEMFSIDGHEVYTAESGLQALHELKAMNGKDSLPDVIFTDLGMPGMDGYELTSEIQKNFENIPVILLSGWGHQINESENRSDDFFCVLSKPPRIKILRDVLGRISERGNRE